MAATVTKAQRESLKAAADTLGPEWALSLTDDGKKHQKLRAERDGEVLHIPISRGNNRDPQHMARLVRQNCREIMLKTRRKA